MKENKKHIILVLGLAAVIAVAAAVLTCVLLMPKLMLGRRLNEILKDTYTYNAEASVAELIWEYLEMSSKEVLPEAEEMMLYMATYHITVLSALKYTLKTMEKLCSTLRSFLRVR